jgi:hypothetical protein
VFIPGILPWHPWLTGGFQPVNSLELCGAAQHFSVTNPTSSRR